MLRLVTIDLTGADLAVFEAYEAKVLLLVAKHGGRVDLQVRRLDGISETHLLFFPDAQAFERYRDDPVRTALRGEWERCGAKLTAVEVDEVSY